MKITDSKFIGSFPGYDLAPRHGLPEIAIGGRSNVGKSSLLNRLLNRKNLAQISKTPGKTRLLNFFSVCGKNGKIFLYIVDLPGYGYAKVSASVRASWQSLVEGYIEKSPSLRGFLLLIDSRRGVEDEEIQLVDYLLANMKNVCPVLTKADKLNRSQKSGVMKATTEAFGRFGELVHYPVLHSSKDGTGNDLIWRWMNERINDES